MVAPILNSCSVEHLHYSSMNGRSFRNCGTPCAERSMTDV
jgi:hypothetical protein